MCGNGKVLKLQSDKEIQGHCIPLVNYFNLFKSVTDFFQDLKVNSVIHSQQKIQWYDIQKGKFNRDRGGARERPGHE